MKQCSFCGMPETESFLLLEGMDASICVDCADIASAELANSSMSSSNGLKKPHEIKKLLDSYVIGQENAKKVLSVAVYNHYKRIDGYSPIEIQKSNILLHGPSGSGKTFIVEKLAELLDVPLVIGDATTLTEAGYIGEDVDTLLEKLLAKTNGDIKRAERGIIYIDEIDKIRSLKGSQETGRKPVQEALLKMIEGHDVSISVGKGHMKDSITISTKNILFIVGGAFIGLDEVRKERLGTNQKQLGFQPQALIEKTHEVDKGIIVDDFIKYGMIPEFMGRIPVIVELMELGEQELQRILTVSKGSLLKQYQSLFRLDGVEVEFAPEAVQYIAREALRRKVGARGLRGIVESKMLSLMYEIPETMTSSEEKKKLIITREILDGTEEWKSNTGISV